MQQINILRMKIQRLKDASMFDVREAATNAIDSAIAVIEEQDKRLQRLENILKNVESIA